MQSSDTRSPFHMGFKAGVERALAEIIEVYKADPIPWVVGYSGGKDSTATLQLVWMALRRLAPDERHKHVYVISTDTMVENPVVSAWVRRSLACMREAAAQQGLKLSSHPLTPKPDNTFWVNLIGRGYPAPRPPGFRWCTDRLKIEPSNRFIQEVVRDNGEAVVVLGMRRAESEVRAHVMDRMETKRVRDHLSPNKKLPNAYVYTPIERWSDEDVWMFLMQVPNPWNFDNKDLLTMYQGASSDGECPLVVDDTTPSCGDSRFGCWVCTLVGEDKSMQAMIRNDAEKEWMLPLLELRNEIESRNPEGRRNDRHLRDFRRMNGDLTLDIRGELVHGPYLQHVREHWLRRLLGVQQAIRKTGPEAVRDIELITLPELHEIRRLWVNEKHEFEDNLPAIYEEIIGQPFPGERLSPDLPFGPEELKILADVCGNDRIHYELIREYLDICRRHRVSRRRAGVPAALDRATSRGFYESSEDALQRALRRRDLLEQAEYLITQSSDEDDLGNFVEQETEG